MPSFSINFLKIFVIMELTLVSFISHARAQRAPTTEEIADIGFLIEDPDSNFPLAILAP
jgi:hypothetical protein